MKITLVIGSFALIGFPSFGQTEQTLRMKIKMDSIRAKYLDQLAWKNPLLRQAGVTTDVFAPSDMVSNLQGNPFFRGNSKIVRTNAYFNIPVVHTKKNILSAGFAASHQAMQLYNVTTYEPSLPVGTTQVHNTLLGASLTFTRIDTLFHKPVVYSATASGLTNPVNDQYRFTLSGVMTMTVRRTPNSTFSIGLLALLDPSAPLPLIPFISYYHTFKSGLSFSLDPSAIVLRKELTARSSIALANNIGGNLMLFKRDLVNLPIKQAYSTLEMKSGFVYEHLLTNKLVFSMSAGVSTTFTSKVLGDNNYTNPFITNTQSMVPYARVGVSFLPFWKGFNHE